MELLKPNQMTYNNYLKVIEDGGIHTVGCNVAFEELRDNLIHDVCKKFDHFIFDDPSQNLPDHGLIIVPNLHILGSGFSRMRELFWELKGRDALVFCPTYNDFSGHMKFLGGNEVMYLSDTVKNFEFKEDGKRKFYLSAHKNIHNDFSDIDVSHFDKANHREKRLAEILNKENNNWI
ncbi:MAG: hypothetical protein SLAVMIC_00843 [uncultured marine phage]|uniref:Uncharacterized protein n=1 Tax=uncultured marine phage TaxID=707152 RepID=A0A8D9C9N4_9VIRU|nr:MAG: hypothetical protein SLAVMIC_00843 [uncultured marine phage]